MLVITLFFQNHVTYVLTQHNLEQKKIKASSVFTIEILCSEKLKTVAQKILITAVKIT